MAAAGARSIATRASQAPFADSFRIVGGSIGTNAGDLISKSRDRDGPRLRPTWATITAPTLSETIAFAAEAFEL
jgi:hypothetical protein